MSATVVCALYKFIALENFQALQQPLHQTMCSHDVRGTVLLAAEGVNGTIAGSRQGVDAVVCWLEQEAALGPVDRKESLTENPPFKRTKVKLKREIVTLGVEGIDPTDVVGTYVEPEAWNDLLDDPNVLLVDTRNEYEVEIGSFENAVNPHTESFREFPDFVKEHLDPQRHKKVAMFCTGGIRCEKSTALLKTMGFENVYHLKGGILNYLAQVPRQQSKWQGECFVFDERVTVDHDLQPGGYDQCHACRLPVSDADKVTEFYCEGVSCPRCYDKVTAEDKARFAERQHQVELAMQRGTEHMGSAAMPPGHSTRKD